MRRGIGLGVREGLMEPVTPSLIARVRARAARLPLIGGGFARDTATLTFGVAIGQIVTMATSPILTRLYTPAEFGAFSAFVSITSTVAAIICLSYEPAIVLPEREDEAASLVALCFINVLVVSTIAGVVSFLFASRLIGDDSEWSAVWIPVFLVGGGVAQALNYWATRRTGYGRLAVSRVGQSISTAALQLLAIGRAGLVYGAVIGQFVAALVLVVADSQALVRCWRTRPPTLRVLWELLNRYRRFPIYSTWGTFMNSAAFQVVPLLLLPAFGSAVAGLYFLGARMASIPMSLAGAAIGQVVLQRSADELARGRPVGPLVEAVLGKLIMLSVVPFVFLAIAAPAVFGFVFGEQWRAAGTFLRVLTPLFWVQFLSSPVSMVLFALQRQREVAFIQTCLLVGAVSSLMLGEWLSLSPEGCLGLYAAVQATLYLVYLRIVVRASAASPRAILRHALSVG